MKRGVVSRSLFLVLPVIAITCWFLYDGGISFGWNFIYYWMCIIGFLAFYEVVLIANSVYSKAGEINRRDNRSFIWIGTVLLIASVLYFITHLD